ncbi:MAG: SUMF1/EgtB/PvdO family nonheme iron enzyme [Bradymonadales bacterium]|nr:SUMF1/EgtB/PvdO family nonheme iron enzyme [Bradymonadales bacterium]
MIRISIRIARLVTMSQAAMQRGRCVCSAWLLLGVLLCLPLLFGGGAGCLVAGTPGDSPSPFEEGDPADQAQPVDLVPDGVQPDGEENGQEDAGGVEDFASDDANDGPFDLVEDLLAPDGTPDGQGQLDIYLVDRTPHDGGDETATGPCPEDMVSVADFCIDRYEAPNIEGSTPLVMISLLDAHAWCTARGKRLCYDDEWTRACGGPDGLSYPYGDTRIAGRCNDEETWRSYDQELLNGWPRAASASTVNSFAEQLSVARNLGAAASAAADHVQWLYQAEPGGQNSGCMSAEGVFDLCGNIEEWTRRRDGGSGTDYTGALKGRYWAESRTCQSAVTSHADPFRFYETGFRCCLDPIE